MEKGQRNETEQDILVRVIQDEIDFISYMDVKTERLHTIVTNDECSVVPPLEGDYAEVNREHISEHIHPEDRALCEKQFELLHIKKELETKEKTSITYRLLAGDVYRRKEMRIYYQMPDKKTLVFVRRDVTDTYEEEQKQKELLRHALKEAKHANTEKNDFLERMSYEIRTPMNSIIGLSYLSKVNVDNKKRILENMDKVDMSAHFLLSFVNDILNLSQIESGKIALKEEVIDFETFFGRLKQNVQEKVDEKKIRFSVEKRGTFENSYCFDADKLEKALMNVLQNAVKFTQVEGKIDFIVELLRESEKNATLRFEVRDNGCGIDEAFLPHVFEPFEQEDNGNTTLAGGTGLGLAIAKKNIECMDGKVDVYSEKGNGATFVIIVKVKRVEECMKKPYKQNQTGDLDYDFTGKRVLLVEDNEINIEITQNILKHKNFAVDVVTDGKACIEKFLDCEAGYYDAILMDIRMPVMDGLTATKKIRASHHKDHESIPIIAMTANAFEEDAKKSFEAGMDAYLSKPIDIRQMYSLLDNVIYG